MTRWTIGDSRGAARSERRQALRVVLGAAGCAMLGGVAGGVGCAEGGADAPPVARLPLSDVPPDTRVVVNLAGRPVELLRSAAGVTARSLLCTHFGCRVAWDPAESLYVCPCHDGRFDAAGRPVGGPPREPLAAVQARVDGDRVIVGG